MWRDLLVIALGELGLKPWEFRRYSWEEFLAMLEGVRTMAEIDTLLVRSATFKICSYSGAHGGMKKGTKVEKFWPLPYDKRVAKKVGLTGGTGKPLKGRPVKEVLESLEKKKWSKAN